MRDFSPNIKVFTGFFKVVAVYYRLFLVLFIAVLPACKQRAPEHREVVTECLEESYQTLPKRHGYSPPSSWQKSEAVQIGDQVWMKYNLDTDTFQNGDIIPQARTAEEWLRAGIEGKPAWCYYLDNECLGTFSGKLYNFFVIEDPRGIAPAGWHVASDEDWNRLERTLGSNLGDKLKSIEGWLDGGKGTNESGFDGRPGGMRYYDGTFFYFGHYGFWWTSSDVVIEHAHIRNLIHDYGSDVFHNKAGKRAGLSIRCVMNYDK